MASFPDNIKTWVDKVDFVDDVSSKHINDAYAEIIAIENDLHGATPSATANKYIKRDASGRAQVAAPSAAGDIARKADVDAVNTALTSHKNESATDAHTPSNVGIGTVSVNFKRTEVRQPQIKDYSETVSINEVALGEVSLDIANGNAHNITLTGATILTFSNPAPTGQACSFTLIVNQGATAYALTYPSSVSWDNDSIPDISKASKTHILVFTTFDGGTRWYGRLAMGGMTT